MKGLAIILFFLALEGAFLLSASLPPLRLEVGLRAAGAALAGNPRPPAPARGGLVSAACERGRC